MSSTGIAVCAAWKILRSSAFAAGLDRAGGRLLAFLDASGLSKNTIVIYTTDNGWDITDISVVSSAGSTTTTHGF